MTNRDKRPLRIAAGVLLVVSLLCTQLPLLNYLGFEFSLVIALCASLISGLLHLSAASRMERGTPYAQFVLRSLGSSLLLALIPLAVSALNAMLVKNCSLAEGAVYYLLLVPPAIFFSICLSTLIAAVADRWRKTWFGVIVLFLLLQIIYVTVTRPQIFAFNYIIGFFPGVTYDERLQLAGRLLVFRAETILAGMLMLGLGRLADAFRTRPLFAPLPREGSPRSRLLRRYAALTVTLGLVWGAMVLSSESLGLASTTDSIEEALGGRVEGDNIVLIYPKAVLSPNAAQHLLDLHEFLFDELSRELHVSPRRKIASYIYPSAAVKGLLVGAARTDIAKPWLGQLHINLEDVDAVLKHEMVHVMAADFGFVLFRVGVNPGLIEGLAVAVERKQYGEMLHRLARSVEVLGVRSTVNDLFSVSGFIRAPATVSYTLAGSFSRFLIDRYGMRRFKHLYRTGKFEEIYHKSIDQLQMEWREMLHTITPTKPELEKAAYFFKRSTIFGKVCVRVIAELNGRTRDLLARNSLDSAAELSARSLALTKTPEALQLHASALFRLGRYEQAVSFIGENLKDTLLAPRLLPIRRTLGMALWALGRKAEARRTFEILMSTRISLAWAEDAALRLQVMGERNGDSLFSLFAGTVADSEAVAFLHARQSVAPVSQSTYRYLLGLAYERLGERDSARGEFSGARFRDPLLELSRIRRTALAEFGTGMYQKAKMDFWEARNVASSAAVELDLDEWIRRCDWMTEKARSDPFTRTRGAGERKIDFRSIFLLVDDAVLTDVDQPRSFLWQ